MQCSSCGVAASLDDVFCPSCGEVLPSRLPVRRQAAPTPALWRQAAPVVVRGAALVLAGVVGEWLLRSATRRALRIPLEGRRQPPRERAVAPEARRTLPEGAIAVSETVVMRRVIVKR